MPVAGGHAIWRKNIVRDSAVELCKAASQLTIFVWQAARTRILPSGPHRALAPQFRFKRPVMELQLGRGDGDPQEIRPTGSVENQ